MSAATTTTSLTFERVQHSDNTFSCHADQSSGCIHGISARHSVQQVTAVAAAAADAVDNSALQERAEWILRRCWHLLQQRVVVVDWIEAVGDAVATVGEAVEQACDSNNSTKKHRQQQETS